MSSAQAPVSVTPGPVVAPQQSLEKGAGNGSNAPAAPPKPVSKNYKGFVAGVFSGIAKLSGKLDQGGCWSYRGC